MASEQQTKVYVVRGDGTEPSSALKEAFEAMQEMTGDAKWVTPDQCLQAEYDKYAIYVTEEFEGPTFDHLVEIKNKVYGPIIILDCLKNEEFLPRHSTPLYSRAMKGLVVTMTSLNPDARAEASQKLEWMMATVKKELHEQITHLVAGEVGSKKYTVAAALKKKIMSVQWVEEVWKASKSSFVHGADPQFAKLRCPVFLNLVISVSALDSAERNYAKDLIQREGGTFTGEMNIDKNTHLIVDIPRGQKYQAAKKWQLKIVTTRWLHDSAESGYCMDERLYPVGGPDTDDSPGHSTPSKSRMSAADQPDLSMISTTHINETNMNNTVNMSTMSTTNARRMSVATENCVDTFVPKPGKGEMYLDGCKIFLSGFNAKRTEKLRRIINMGGGTRFNQLNESVSHVVIGDEDEGDVKILQSANFRPHVVNVQWLLDSCSQDQCMPEEAYYCLNLPQFDPTSPEPKLKKKPPTRQSSSTSTTGTFKAPNEQGNHTTDRADDMQHLMSQYLPQNKTDTMGESTLMRAAEAGEAMQTSHNSTLQQSEHEDSVQQERHNSTVQQNDVTMDPDETVELPAKPQKLIFKGKTMAIFGFETVFESDLKGYIEQNGGKVVPSNYRKIPDYAVLPVFGGSVEITVGDVVTNAWIQMCVESNCLMPIEGNELFTPVEVASNLATGSDEPLQGCVLSITGYQGTERDVLIHIAGFLGATVQEYFLRRAIPEKNFEGNTHLIVSGAQNSKKFMAAKKWKIPTISKHWLLACMAAGRKVPETMFIVDAADGASEVQQGTLQTPSSVSNQANISQAGEDTNSKQSPETKKCTISTPVEPPRTRSPLVSRPDASGTNQQTPLANNTPAVKHNRVKDLIQNDKSETPKPNPSRRVPKLSDTPRFGVESPSVFLDPSYVPKLDFTAAKACLDTPVQYTPGGRRKPKRKPSLDLEELFAAKIAIAVENSNRLANDQDQPMSQTGFTGSPRQQENEGPLASVVIAVSKKLSSNQSEYNNMAEALGADYRWTYDKSCTHFIFQGRQNDMNKEFRMAREHKKKIVSPHWLIMCKEQNCLVDESLFPHTYNPNMALNVTSTTPARGTRKSVRNKQNTPTCPVPIKKSRSDMEAVAKPAEKSDDSDDLKSSTLGRKSDDSDQEKSSKIGRKSDDSDEAKSSKIGRKSDDSDEAKSSRIGRKSDDSDEATPKNQSSEKSPEERGVSKCKNDEEIDTGADDKKSEKDSTAKAEALVEGIRKLMASKKPSGHVRRNSRSMRKDSFEQVEGSDSRRGSRPSSRTGQDLDASGGRNRVASRRTSRRFTSAPADTQIEASQMYEVGWEDPAVKRQQELMAKDLAADSESYSPTRPHGQSSDEDGRVKHNSSREESDMQDEDTSFKLPGLPQRRSTSEEPAGRVPTPEPPSLAFPLPKTSKIVSPPKPIELVADPEEEANSRPVILLSGMSVQERTDYAALIEELGGQTLDVAYFDNRCTHLVVSCPNRNEKFLACVSQGKWVLHKSYLEASRAEGKFVKEHDHEWGSAATEGIQQGLKPQFQKLVKAAHYWRLTQEEKKKTNPNHKGAFEGWKTVLVTDPKRCDNFKRLLLAGGAEVLATKPPYNDLENITHAFFELGKIQFTVDVGSFLNAGVHCLKPEFIAAFLTDDPPVLPENFYLPEVKQALEESTVDNRKRKSSGNNTPSAKRTCSRS